MRLYLKGHGCRYAVESILLTLFPGERPEYPETGAGEGDNRAEVGLSAGQTWVTAHTRLAYGGRAADGYARARLDQMGDELSENREKQKIVKLSFYRAAARVTGREPVWGALTGVRPGKLAAKRIEAGETRAETERALRETYRVSPERSRLCVDAALAGLRVKGELTDLDAALYVGIPFCPTRCTYCSFVSIGVEKSGGLIEPFLQALYREINAAAEAAARLNLRINSVYFGGGTPTTLTAEQLRGLMDRLGSSFDLSRVREYTVEAGRPDTVTPEKLAAIREGGADRISINPQTMSAEVLRAIGRRHTPEEIPAAFALARRAGFETINMDLIAGLPGDSPAGFAASLDAVLNLGPENVTVHTLSLKKGSRLSSGGGSGDALPGGETVGEMLDHACARLRGTGYAPYYLYRAKYISGGYENVGWTKPGGESLYNILVMEELCSVLALGGAASTKLVDRRTGYIKRLVNPKYPREYVDGIDRVLEGKRKIGAFYRNRHMI